MNLEETVTLIAWVNQHDARIQVNGPSRDIWANAMQPYTIEEARQAILDHYRVNDDQAVTPGMVRKRAEIVRSSRAGVQSAIEAAPKPVKSPMSWRARNPELWDELFESGRREGNEAREAATRARAGL